MDVRHALVAALLVLSARVPADMVLLSFDDRSFATSQGAGDTLLLQPLEDRTEGAGAIGVIYRHGVGSAWTKTPEFKHAFPAPVDASRMESLAFDVRMPAADPRWVMVIKLTDSAGGQVRILDYDVFRVPTSQWRTVRHPFSAWTKSQWAGEGRAANLRSIVSVSIQAMNHKDVAPAGELRFDMDNVTLREKGGGIRENTIDDFESYTSEAGLATAWSRGDATRVSSSPCFDQAADGTRSMRLSVARIDGVATGPLVLHAFPAARDLLAAKYLRVSVKGDPALAPANPVLLMYLVDANGERAIGRIAAWPARAEWSDVLLPFDLDGIEATTGPGPNELAMGGRSCWRQDTEDAGGWRGRISLSRAKGIGFALRCDTPFDGTASILIDGIRVGYGGDVTATGPSSAPTPVASTPTATPSPSFAWQTPESGAHERALREHKPMIVYFRNNTVAKCDEIEKGLLGTEEFRARASKFVCIKADIDAAKSLAERYGVYRVPAIFVIDRGGNPGNRLVYSITADNLYTELDSVVF